jgi:hypothetical protein
MTGELAEMFLDLFWMPGAADQNSELHIQS